MHSKLQVKSAVRMDRAVYVGDVVIITVDISARLDYPASRQNIQCRPLRTEAMAMFHQQTPSPRGALVLSRPHGGD